MNEDLAWAVSSSLSRAFLPDTFYFSFFVGEGTVFYVRMDNIAYISVDARGLSAVGWLMII